MRIRVACIQAHGLFQIPECFDFAFLLEQQHAEMMVCIGEFRFEFYRCEERLLGLGEFPLAHQQNA